MNLFETFKVWIQKIFATDSSRLLDQSPDVVKRDVLGEYDRHLEDIQKAMVHLVYERKNLEHQLRVLKEERVALEEDLNNCLYENKDNIAAEILSQLENMKTEEQFYLSQLDKIRVEIEKAKEADREMQNQMRQAKHQLNLLIGKQKLLTVRKQLMKRLDRTTSMIERKVPTLQLISEKVQRLEAETEVHQMSEPQWQNEIQNMRKSRREAQYVSKVKQMKRELFQKSLMPGRSQALVAEVVK